jgi:DNA-directed RNA polymerase specialized sigma24 family protein
LIHYISRILEDPIRADLDYFDAQKRVPADGQLVSTEKTDKAGEPASELISSHAGPAEEVASLGLGELYDSCVQSLDDVQREVILLREHADASW